MKKIFKIFGALVIVAIIFTGIYVGVNIYNKEIDASKESFVSYENNEKNSGIVEDLKTEEKKIIIVLDPGHGGIDSGAISKSTGLYEKNIAYSIALACKERLEEDGRFKVYLTRDDMSEEQKMDLIQRSDIAKEKNAEWLISLHLNATDYGRMNGVTTYSTVNITKKEYHDNSLIMANSILNSICGKCNIKNLGAKTKESEEGRRFDCDGTIADNYGIVKGGIERGIPTVLIEHGYIDSDDINFFDTLEERRNIGYADAEGIINYYNKMNK